MGGTLILAILNVRSSYLEAVEESLSSPDAVPDTLQWWIGPESVWRIKTFAIDHDIHVHSAGSPQEDTLSIAFANNQKHYGDVIAAQHEIHLPDLSDAEVAKAFSQLALPSRLEVAELGFAFWKPDDADYRTQSRPD